LTEREFDLKPLLAYIPPSDLSYQEWVNIGMALKYESYDFSDWDSWSQADSRYKAKEMESKWASFENSTGAPITGAFITLKAKEYGWTPRTYDSDDGNIMLDWDDEISVERDYKFVDKTWVEGKEILEPKVWNPVQQISTYIKTLFDSTDHVGYVVQSRQNEDGKWIVGGKGNYSSTAGELLESLGKVKDDDIGVAFGDYKQEAGAWIRFNPLDGKGVKNDNVTDYRFALAESDSLSMEKQNAIMHELELPIAALVSSGGKSIHAIVRVDAPDYKEYQKRVEYLYKICNKNGLTVDTQNKNPSRLSRMPGVMRGDRKQFLIDTNIGKASWDEWFEWMEDLNDNLPDFESLEDLIEENPELSPTLIDGILRKGHKMLVAGPSKAGKSFALMEMCISIAEGLPWFGFQCQQGKVLYINMELDRPSAYKRFVDIYKAMNLPMKNVANIGIWNMRGHSIPMDKLTPKLIRRAQKENYDAIIIDPIYKVLTGSENDAEQMAKFTNQFDKVAMELGTSVIYCHHHSKGAQGGKNAMDRSSGSGVFARDPDAILDLSELVIKENLTTMLLHRATATFYAEKIRDEKPAYLSEIGQDDFLSAPQMRLHLEWALGKERAEYIAGFELETVKKRTHLMTAWRVEGTLREFPKFDPVNLWFDYPLHRIDDSDVLKDALLVGEEPARSSKGENKKQKEPKESKDEKFSKALRIAYDNLNQGEGVGTNDFVNYFEDKKGFGRTSVKGWLNSEKQKLFQKNDFGKWDLGSKK
jgi:RecA-family ATPase